ncbi:MAG: 50S ribosomal protein L19 [Candidatus Brocadiia bacterium]
MNVIDKLEAEQMQKRGFFYGVGDTVEVHAKIKEGDKERVSRFIGIVIAKRGGGLREVFTVRRIVQGKGVERTFTVHSPNLVDVKVIRLGRVRRAKLYFLRERTGRAARPEELILSKDELKKRRAKAGIEVPSDGLPSAEAQQAVAPVQETPSAESKQ